MKFCRWIHREVLRRCLHFLWSIEESRKSRKNEDVDSSVGARLEVELLGWSVTRLVPQSTTEAVFHNFQSNRSVHFYLDPYGVDVISNFLPDHRFPGNYFNQINHLQSHWVLPSTDCRSLLLLHSAEEKYNFKVFQVLERTGMSPSDAKSSKW